MSATAFKPAEVNANSDCTLLLPENDVINPEFSIVLPAMNERLTIGDTIEWCKEGFRKAGVTGEVLIIDTNYSMTHLEQTVAQVTADKPGRAGD